MSNRKKVYKTPQAVHDFIRGYRKEALNGVDSWGNPEVLKAIEANLARLKEFLLSQCDPLASPEVVDTPEDERDTERPPPTGGWEW